MDNAKRDEFSNVTRTAQWRENLGKEIRFTQKGALDLGAGNGTEGAAHGDNIAAGLQPEAEIFVPCALNARAHYIYSCTTVVLCLLHECFW